MSEISQAQKTALLKIPGMKLIQKQYAKEQSGSGMKRGMKGMGKMRGKGFWDDVGNWFSQAGKDVNQFLKDSKIVSNVAAYALPILGAMGGALLTANPLGATAGGIAGKSTADYIKSQGYGKHTGMGAMHRMPDGSMMKGKMHGGELSNKLVLNPPNQRMRGIMGKGSDDTFGFNGVQQKSIAPMKAGIMGNLKGNGAAPDFRLKRKTMIGAGGIPYGSISSEFGNVKF